jgi:hypothetical protein
VTHHVDSGSEETGARTWSDAFPWLRGTVDLHELSWWDTAIDEDEDPSWGQRLARLSDLVVTELQQWSIGQVFPGLAPDTELLSLSLPTRALNTLGRHGYFTGESLLGITVADMMRWRNVGVGTVDAILRALAGASATAATVIVPDEIGFSDPEPDLEVLDDTPLTAGVHDLVEDLHRVAKWYATIGDPGRLLLSGNTALGTPEHVQRALEKLQARRADELLTTDERDRDVAALLDEAIDDLGSRTTHVLASRLFAESPATLDEIGQALAITRERVRQIEGKARAALLDKVASGESLALVARAVRDVIVRIRPLDELITAIPALGKTVEAVEQPAWRVLDRLDSGYEISAGWCVMGTVNSARDDTHTHVQGQSDRYGVARLDALDLIETDRVEGRLECAAAWLTHCGYLVDGDFVLTRTQSVQDYGAAILSIVGSPLSAQEIVDRFKVKRSPTSLRNAMNEDERFERVDRDKWALKEWGIPAYSGIRSVIRERVTQDGGAIRLEDLIEHITGRYTVSVSSVIAYASSPPFENKSGVVRFADSDRGPRKLPERTRRFYRRPHAWAYRVRMTSDHLRGSGFMAPVALAGILNMRFGDTQQLESPLGPQSVAWTGTQPAFGSIRRFLMDGDVAIDSEALLIIGDAGTFDFELVRERTGYPLEDALALVGITPLPTSAEAKRALAEALKLPADSPISSIIGEYRERGDADVADLLTRAREHLETTTAHERSVPSIEVDDILDLL